MLERDDADDLGRALVHELLTGADWVIYDNYIRRQLVPYTAHTALQHALQIVDVRLGLYCYYAPALGGGHFGIARSVRLSVPWRSCLGYRHTGCSHLSHRRPPEVRGLRTRPRTDVDPPRFLNPRTDSWRSCLGYRQCLKTWIFSRY